MDKLMADLKVQIIDQLNLQDLSPEDIGNDEPLFVEGLGLDSIDALELIVLLQQHYKIKLASADEGPKVFKSVRTMAEYITAYQNNVVNE
jgi:acyl carrier protein